MSGGCQRLRAMLDVLPDGRVLAEAMPRFYGVEMMPEWREEAEKES